MKKILIASAALLFVGTSVSITSCTKVFSCVNATLDVANASAAFDNDPSNANCIKYKDALQKFLNNSNCVKLDTASASEFQEELDSLKC